MIGASRSRVSSEHDSRRPGQRRVAERAEGRGRSSAAPSRPQPRQNPRDGRPDHDTRPERPPSSTKRRDAAHDTPIGTGAAATVQHRAVARRQPTGATRHLRCAGSAHQTSSSSSASPTVRTPHQLAASRHVGAGAVAVRQHAAGETHLRGLLHAQRALRDARAPRRPGRPRRTPPCRGAPAGCAGSRPRPPRRPGRPPARRRVMPPAMLTKTSSASQVQPAALLEHGQQQRQAVRVEAAGHAPGVAVGARAHERLHFDQHRPRAFDAAHHGRPGRRRPGAAARNSSDGLGTARSPLPVISNTPSSLMAPKRFFTARTTRCAWCRSPSK